MSSTKRNLGLGIFGVTVLALLGCYAGGLFNSNEIKKEKSDFFDLKIDNLNIEEAFKELNKINSNFDLETSKRFLFSLNSLCALKTEELEKINIEKSTETPTDSNKNKSNKTETPIDSNKTENNQSNTKEESPKPADVKEKEEKPKSEEKEEKLEKDNFVKMNKAQVEAVKKRLEKIKNELFGAGDKSSEFIKQESKVFNIITDKTNEVDLSEKAVFIIKNNQSIIDKLFNDTKSSRTEGLNSKLSKKVYTLKGKGNVSQKNESEKKDKKTEKKNGESEKKNEVNGEKKNEVNGENKDKETEKKDGEPEKKNEVNDENKDKETEKTEEKNEVNDENKDKETEKTEEKFSSFEVMFGNFMSIE